VNGRSGRAAINQPQSVHQIVTAKMEIGRNLPILRVPHTLSVRYAGRSPAAMSTIRQPTFLFRAGLWHIALIPRH
jgi:hypothetical protein